MSKEAKALSKNEAFAIWDKMHEAPKKAKQISALPKNLTHIEALEILKNQVLIWWEQHQFDCVDLGEDGERNMFDEPPEFVKIAQEIESEVT